MNEKILTNIPEGLRKPLIDEFKIITQKYLEGKWRDSGLSGGLFCEIVYTIINGAGSGVFANKASKPSNFPEACRKLENYTNISRSLQILIPRMLPPLYEIRNNRSIGHVGGDVDSNQMDCTAVVSNASWIMGELIRVFHSTSLEEAQNTVNRITSRNNPLVWNSGDIKRVLNPQINYKEQILLLLSGESNPVDVKVLLKWTEYSHSSNFRRLLSNMHKERLIEYDKKNDRVEILPPGGLFIEDKLTDSLN